MCYAAMRLAIGALFILAGLVGLPASPSKAEPNRSATVSADVVAGAPVASATETPAPPAVAAARWIRMNLQDVFTMPSVASARKFLRRCHACVSTCDLLPMKKVAATIMAKADEILRSISSNLSNGPAGSHQRQRPGRQAVPTA
jgi:hypothetical protein